MTVLKETLPELFQAEQHMDERGILSFFNQLDISQVKRFYVIEHPDTKIIRAWQGHRVEQKWFCVIKGIFSLATIKPDDWTTPSKDLKPVSRFLSSKELKILHVPGGFATGFRALEANSKMLIFSNATLEESKRDDYRFDKEWWSEALW